MRAVIRGYVAAFIPLLSGATLLGQSDTVTIIHVNDTHSKLAPIGPRTAGLEGKLGGIARAATVIRTLVASNPNPVFLHAGDVSTGDIFYNAYFGVPEYRILSSLGCKAMAVGNHEWDLTPVALLRALDTAFVGGGQFPLLSANTILKDPAAQPLNKYIRSYTIEKAGAARIGIFGLTTPETNLLSSPSPAVIDTNIRPVAAAMVETLMVKGCNYIILLSHLGIFYDQMIGSMVSGINAIVGGHDHLAMVEPMAVVNPTGDTTWIVQANSSYLSVGRLRLARRAGKVHLLDYALIPVDSTTAKEPTVDGIVTGLTADIEKKHGNILSHEIGFSTGFFKETADSLMYPGHHDTPIGNLVTDAFRALVGTEIAIEAGGSTAEPIYPGPLVADDAFRVVGYGFNTVNGLGYHLVRVDMVGAVLRQCLEFGLSKIDLTDEYFLQCSGMKYEYNPNAPAGQRLGSVTVGGVPLDPGTVYSVAANYFSKLFLDILGMPYSNYHEYAGDTTEFKALTQYVMQRGTISPSPLGRILSSVKEESGAVNRRKSSCGE